MFGLFRNKTEMVTPDSAHKGHDDYMFPVPELHAVNGHRMKEPFPEGLAVAHFGMGCFWGVERIFWQLDGVYSTAAGYGGGYSPYPTYQEVCSGRTGHNELVQVVYDPATISYEMLLKTFWENHDSTQGMRQGNDVGTQYRSGIYIHSAEQEEAAKASLKRYANALKEAGHPHEITTEIQAMGPFYYAEEYHQQYLHKNPGGYCNHGFNGVSCPVGLDVDGI